MRVTVWLALLLALVASSSAWATPDSVQQIKAAAATPVGRTVFSNGLTLLVTEAPAHDLVAIDLLIRVGVVQEPSSMAGVIPVIQDVLASRIKKDGSLEQGGSMLSTDIAPDYARITILTTTEEFPSVLRLLGGALAKRDITDKELHKARNQVLQDLADGESAFPQLYDIFRETFYRYHPYRKTGRGTPLSVQRLTASQVSKFFDTYYVPNRMVLSLAGRVDRLTVVDKVRKQFHDLVEHDLQVMQIPWEPKATKREVDLSESSDIAWLFVGFPAPSVADQDYAAMRLIRAILAEGLSCRLFDEIREKRGLAYELGSIYPRLSGPSHFLIYVISKPHDVGEDRDLIFQQVQRLKTQLVSPEELAQARRKVIGKYLLARETDQGKALNVAIAETIGLGYQYDATFMRDLKAVTPQQMRDVARRYLNDATQVVARPPGFYFDF